MPLIRLLLLLLILPGISACNFSAIKPAPAEERTTTRTQSTAPVKISTRVADSVPAENGPTDNDSVQTETRPAPETDLWAVVRKQLTFARHLDDERVQAKLGWFQRNQDYLDRVADRARPYLYHVVSELQSRNMPLELALLPIIESAYHPFAYSPSHASGLWQFIPGTGKRFGLKQNWWYDGRRDVVSATDAALRYLQQLSERFNGDWELALAAYNAGEYRIERAVRTNLDKGRSARFWSLKLPRETRHSGPGLWAIAEIVANPGKYNLTLKPIENVPYFAEVPVDGQIDLARVSELSGLGMDDVYTLNPAFNRWATDPNGPHRLLLPVKKAAQFQARLATIPADERIQWQQYKIKNGDTLGAIAARYRTSVAALKDTNRLRNSRIRAGKSLLIPVSSKPANHYTLSQDARRFKNLKSTGDGKKFLYTVKRGDTLWDIGRHYGFSVNQLCKWNGIHKRSTLSLGQKLAIYIQDEEPQGRIVPAVAHTDADRTGVLSYTVKQGDSLWLIARKHGVTVKQILKWNNLRKDHYLQPGQNIEIQKATTGA